MSTSDFSEIVELQQFKKLYEEQEDKQKLQLAEKDEHAAPSQGRAIDHLGWAVTAVDTKVGDLAAKGLKTVEPRAVRNLRVAFVEGPGGVRIEMVQGRTEEELIGR